MAAVRAEQTDGAGLTTTKAPFIEQAQHEGRLYIHQPYELYSNANHDAWRRLFARMGERWRQYANPRFIQGIDSLCLEPTRVPRLEDVNRFLSPLTGFKAKAVSEDTLDLPLTAADKEKVVTLLVTQRYFYSVDRAY